MRLATLLLLALPAIALAQPAPQPRQPPQSPGPATSAHAPATDHKPAAKPANPDKNTKPTPAKPAPSKPAPGKPTPGKLAPGKLAPGKLASGKLASGKTMPKPTAHKPPPAAVVPVPVPAPAEPPAEPNKGSKTGLPVPRYAALRSDDVNFRSGPGPRYPIEWVYKRRDLPVLIEREFDVYFLVKDPFGNQGWVSQATLTGRRTAVVAGAERMLRQAPSDTAGLVAKLKPGVILRLRSCDAGSEWCQAQIADYRGYIRRSEIWGVMADEVIQ